MLRVNLGLDPGGRITKKITTFTDRHRVRGTIGYLSELDGCQSVWQSSETVSDENAAVAGDTIRSTPSAAIATISLGIGGEVPERIVRITRRRISGVPIRGTRDANIVGSSSCVAPPNAVHRL